MGLIDTVRSNAIAGLWLKVDASRRRNDPRKPVKDIGEHGAV